MNTGEVWVYMCCVCLCICAKMSASMQTCADICMFCVKLCVCLCSYILACLAAVCLWCEGTHTHTSFCSPGGRADYYESLAGEGGENKRMTTRKWQQTAETERFTSLIPAHRDLKQLSI